MRLDFWNVLQEKRDAEILDCLHPLEWRSKSEICEKLHKNRAREKPGKRILLTSEDTVSRTLKRLAEKENVELNLRFREDVEFQINGEMEKYSRCEFLWRLSGNVKPKKVKKEKPSLNLLPQSA